VLGYDASTKTVKLKLSEATLKKEMLKGNFSSVMEVGHSDFEENLYLFTCTASKEARGRFTLTEEAQEPLAECQELVCVCARVASFPGLNTQLLLLAVQKAGRTHHTLLLILAFHTARKAGNGVSAGMCACVCVLCASVHVCVCVHV